MMLVLYVNLERERERDHSRASCVLSVSLAASVDSLNLRGVLMKMRPSSSASEVALAVEIQSEL